jgi:hypothetical protein
VSRTDIADEPDGSHAGLARRLAHKSHTENLPGAPLLAIFMLSIDRSGLATEPKYGFGEAF